MRTFEFDDGKSRKFWNITLQGSSFTVAFGKIGSKGQTQTKDFPDAARAQKEHDKLVAEKLKKGYVETTAASPAAELAAEVDTPLRRSLEAALVENPEDLAAHMAYGDYLHEQGDPRGEFVQVQLALEDEGKPAAERKALQQRERALLAAHERAWLGPMAAFWLDQEVDEYMRRYGAYHQLTWRRGWIDALHIEDLSTPVAEAVVARQPLLRLLRSLKIRARDYDDPGFAPLLAGDFYSNVRFFQIGRENEGCHMEGENTVEFVEKMPLLEELHTYARRVDTGTLFGMSLPHLRKLTVYHIYDYPLEVLAANKSLGNVTDLAFWPHGLEPDDDAAYISSEAAQALFRSPHLTSLRHLQIRLSDTGDEGVRVLVESGLLKRLKTLDLYGGRVGDAGAHLLAECPDLRNLEALDLGCNMLTAAGVAALRGTVVEVELKNQCDPDDEEREYLWEGDPE